MVGIGLLRLAAGWIGAWLWWRGRLFDSRWYLQPVAWSWWLGFVAVISGWIVTETGRQPWVAYGILRTADAISPVPGASIATTLALLVLVYGIVFAMGIYYINRLINRGPEGRQGRQSSARRSGRCLPPDTGREILCRSSDVADHRDLVRNPRLWDHARKGSRHGMVPSMIRRADQLHRPLCVISTADLNTASCFIAHQRRARPDDELDRAVLGQQRVVRVGGGRLSVVPACLSIISQHLPVIVMLLALVFRGVSFEFRAVADTGKPYWNFFAAGSTLAAFCQGQSWRD
jgi:hypothetical protein